MNENLYFKISPSVLHAHSSLSFSPNHQGKRTTWPHVSPWFSKGLSLLSPFSASAHERLLCPFQGVRERQSFVFLQPKCIPLSWRRVATPKAWMLSAGGVITLLKQTLPSCPSLLPHPSLFHLCLRLQVHLGHSASILWLADQVSCFVGSAILTFWQRCDLNNLPTALNLRVTECCLAIPEATTLVPVSSKFFVWIMSQPEPWGLKRCRHWSWTLPGSVSISQSHFCSKSSPLSPFGFSL